MRAARRVSTLDLASLSETQRQLALQVVERPLAREPAFVAGTDVHIAGNEAVAVVVVMDPQGLVVYEHRQLVRPVDFPYVPGFLSFREAPAVIDAVRALVTWPDLLFVDGQGRAHPRRCGLASHIGVHLGVPTIGVAKSKLVGRYDEPGPERGAVSPLIDDGEVVGMVVRTKAGARPVFVSVGHLITLEEAVSWTLRLARDRIPEPTLRAHREAQRAVAAFRARRS